jgi:acyl-lipid omega-6 desaturase (Delta-12 desaturase)
METDGLVNLRPSELRSVFPELATQKSNIKAFAIFLSVFSAYLLCFIGIVSLSSLGAKLVCALGGGLFIGVLFIIGHDACHGSFTSKRLLNNFIGRLCFLPSLHPFTSWELAHNRLHHGWTNLRGKDYTWCPLSLEEFQRLPAAGRFLERLYRHPIGFGLYYLVEIWWKHMVFPRNHDIEQMYRTISLFDRTTVWLFFLLQVTVLWNLTGSTNSINALVIGFVVPYFIWNWLMGFIIFLHHTHPNTRWFNDPNEWYFFAGQIQNTVHVIFPTPIGLFLHNIMEHTAHHLSPRIPLYNLRSSQRALCEAYSSHVIHFRFTAHEFAQLLRTCQLYDYQNHRWLSFEGVPTTNSAVTNITSA